SWRCVVTPGVLRPARPAVTHAAGTRAPGRCPASVAAHNPAVRRAHAAPVATLVCPTNRLLHRAPAHDSAIATTGHPTLHARTVPASGIRGGSGRQITGSPETCGPDRA